MTPSKQYRAIRHFKIHFLEHLIDKGPAASDCVPVPDDFDDGVNAWRGHAVNELKKDRLIVVDGYTKSTRPTRQCALIRRWRLRDRKAAIEFLAHLRKAESEDRGNA